MSDIEHIVLWPFKNTSDLEFAAQAIKSTVGKARHDGEPYVLSVKCGTTRPSPPVRSRGFNLASIIRFRTDDDRSYFVKEDPAHKELVGLVKDKLASDILVLDFIDGAVEHIPTTAC
ncbi:hypothetical protein ASPVEDRAFT_763477 [Aspergillus versicolor CBS 583.65]|uniref:Stress-response A/B barrel domain-containing protein n=1 Tax=Aspergillus versicolor CBS 583.65 TaxID=1036611 RepID=A0A1L9PQW5_ASPVE|nr:uncharacterized protein ASPVEDRAFT_763477 [Aspergillus versicolor CBS 583.65]OJJ03948.1 hypothetical protein ASPVEDRAFT_763477 [Aspergillus versicolor CBS 583.65]